MRNFIWFLCLSGVILCLSSCDSSLAGSRYTLRFPELPPTWELIPGTLYWKVEWQDPLGHLQTRELRGSKSIELILPNTWVNTIIAWPYWPDLLINPGVFRPAGGLFPFDAEGNKLLLSWKGGVDVILYRELSKTSVLSPPAQTKVPRLPVNFNWPRFRDLYEDPGVNAEYRSDPWLADWPAIAERIWTSGFDRRRLVPQVRQELRIIADPAQKELMAGPWIGTSPFAQPLFFDNTVPVFRVRSAPATGSPPVDTWVSPHGILRCTTSTWFFQEWKN